MEDFLSKNLKTKYTLTWNRQIKLDFYKTQALHGYPDHWEYLNLSFILFNHLKKVLTLIRFLLIFSPEFTYPNTIILIN